MIRMYSTLLIRPLGPILSGVAPFAMVPLVAEDVIAPCQPPDVVKLPQGLENAESGRMGVYCVAVLLLCCFGAVWSGKSLNVTLINADQEHRPCESDQLRRELV
jgi:hypothetical protein